MSVLLKRLVEWGHELVLRLPCGHAAVVLPEWVTDEGVFVGRLSCPDCRKVYEGVRLEGWAA